MNGDDNSLLVPGGVLIDEQAPSDCGTEDRRPAIKQFIISRSATGLLGRSEI